jgi:putative FmdB family regulatory protein
MPIYEYECNKCASRFEVKRGFHESGGNACPECGGEGRQVYLPTTLIFKGSGFYITDSRKKSGHSEEEGQAIKPEPGKEPAKPDAGKPAKPESSQATNVSGSDKAAAKPDAGKKEKNNSKKPAN